MKFRRDKYFLVNLCLIIVGFVLATNGIINVFRNISDGNPEYLLRVIIFPVLIGLGVAMSSFFRILKPRTGVVGDERTKRAVEKAGLYAFLILSGLLIASASVAGILQLNINFSLALIVLLYIGIFSWGMLVYYFDKKGDLE
jgi:uncharacterized membrane-anchored protein